MIRSVMGGNGRFITSVCSFFHRSYCICCGPLLLAAEYRRGSGLLTVPFVFRTITSRKKKPPPPPPPPLSNSPKTTLPSPGKLMGSINLWLIDLATKSSIVLKASDFFERQQQPVFVSLYDPTISTEQNFQNLSPAYACWILSAYLVECQKKNSPLSHNFECFTSFSAIIGSQIIPDILASTNLPKYQESKFSVLMLEILKCIMSQTDIRSRFSIAVVSSFHIHALYLKDLTTLTEDAEGKEKFQEFYEVFFKDDAVDFSLSDAHSSQLNRAKITVLADIIFGTLQRQQRPDLSNSVLAVNNSLGVSIHDDRNKPLITYQTFTVNEQHAKHLDAIMHKYFSCEDCFVSRTAFLTRVGDLGFSDYVLRYIQQIRKDKSLLLGTTVFNNAILSQALQGKHENVKELVDMIDDEFEDFHDYVNRKWEFDRENYYNQLYDTDNDSNDNINDNYHKRKEGWRKKPKIGIRFFTLDYYLCGISHYLHQPQHRTTPLSLEEQVLITTQIVQFLDSLPIDPPADTFESIAIVIDGFDDEDLFHRIIEKYFDWLEFFRQQEGIWMVGKNDAETKQIQQALRDEKRLESSQLKSNSTSTLDLRKQVFELNQTKTIDIFARNLIRMKCAREARRLVDRAALLDVKIDPATISALLERMRESNKSFQLRQIFKSIPTKFKLARQYEHAVELTYSLFLTGQLYHGARGFKSIYKNIEKKLQSVANDSTLTEDERYHAMEKQLLFLVTILKKMLKYIQGVPNIDRSKRKVFDENLATNTSIMIMDLLLNYMPPESWSRQQTEVATIHKRLIKVLQYFKRSCYHPEDGDDLFRIFQEQVKSPRIYDILGEVNDIIKIIEERQLFYEQTPEAATEKG